MNLSDSNVWLALAIERHVHHSAAREWFDTVGTAGSVLFCRATQQSFLRLLTTTSVLAPYGLTPLTNQQAWGAYEALLADDRIRFEPGEPAGIEQAWARWATRPTASPKLWMDAYLAAFASRSGATLVTTDRSFFQFDDLEALVLS